MKIVSTKILTPAQKALISNVELEELSLISITYGEGFEIDQSIPNAVFTSANSVRSVFDVHKNATKWFDVVYCVGNKTKALLEKRGVKVKSLANNAIELSQVLVDDLTTSSEVTQEVNWFCGNLKNSELAQILAENGVMVTEYEVYQNTLVPQEVIQDFDAILFYSPSGIKSYLQANPITEKLVICIGATTATEAVQHFENIYIADEQSIEGVLEKAKELLENN